MRQDEHPVVGAGIAQLDAAIAEATPTLTADDRALVRGIYRALALGRPASIEELAHATPLPPDRVEERLEDWPGVFRDEAGAVIGF